MGILQEQQERPLPVHQVLDEGAEELAPFRPAIENGLRAQRRIPPQEAEKRFQGLPVHFSGAREDLLGKAVGRLRTAVRRKSQLAGEHAHDGAEGRVLVIGGAGQDHELLGVDPGAFEKEVRKARLADARLAHDEDEARLPVGANLPPSIEKRVDLLVPAAQWKIGSGLPGHGLTGGQGLQEPEHFDGTADALEFSRAQALEREVAFDQFLEIRADDHTVVRRQAFQSRRDVGRHADDREFLSGRPGPHFARDHASAVDADAHLDRNAEGLQMILVQEIDLPENLEPGKRAPFRRVFVGDRIAEERHHAVAGILADASAQALGGLDTGQLKITKNMSQVLGVQSLRQLGGVDQVAEHDRDLAILAVVVGGRVGHPPFLARSGWNRFEVLRRSAFGAKLRAHVDQGGAGGTAPADLVAAVRAEFRLLLDRAAAPWALHEYRPVTTLARISQTC